MGNLLRFLGYIVFALGFFSLIICVGYYLYRILRKRSYLQTLRVLFTHSQTIFSTFQKHLIRGDIANAEFFIIDELKRKRVEIPYRFRGLRERFAKQMVFSIKKHKSEIETATAAQFHDKIHFEVINTLLGEDLSEMNRRVYTHVLLLVPIVVAGATFFPLLFYTEYYDALLIHPLFFYLGGVALMGGSAWFFTAANR